MTNSGLTYPAAISASCPSRQPFSTARISRPTTYQGSATFCPVWVAGHLARPMTDGRPRPRGLADFNKAPTRCSSGTSDTRKTSLKMHLFSYLYTYTYTHAYMCVSLFLYVCEIVIKCITMHSSCIMNIVNIKLHCTYYSTRHWLNTDLINISQMNIRDTAELMNSPCH